jgi:putative ABC transport system permease protein
MVGDGSRKPRVMHVPPHDLRPLLALRLALSGLRRSPAPAALAVGILMLGLAAPTTFFSLLIGAVRPLPVSDGDRVVRVDVIQPAKEGHPVTVTAMDLAPLQGASSLSDLGAFRTFVGTLSDPDRGATHVPFAVLTPEVLPLLRVEPLIGRVPGPDEAGDAVMIASALWHDLYAGDPGALGSSVTLDGTARTLVGVRPEGFGFPFNERGWIVEDPDPTAPGAWELVGRLSAGATLDAATAELGARWSALDGDREQARVGGALAVRGFTGGRGEGGEAVAFLGLVLIALCLLVIACANVANLLLVRATERVRTLGIQSALGASRLQLGAQLLLESALLASAGGALGLLLAATAISAVQRTLAAEHFGYFWMRMAIDGRVVGFTTALVVGAALLAGVIPLVRVLRTDVQRALREDGVGVSIGGDGALGRAFVTAQLALSCSALVGAGLTGTALAGTRGYGRGLPGDEVLIGSLNLGAGRADREATRLEVEASLRAVPGVRDAAMALGAPGFLEPRSAIELEGVAYERATDRDVTGWNAVTADYMHAFDMTVLAGGGLGSREGAPRTASAVVNQSFARRFGEGGEVLGRRIRLLAADSTTWLTVVGVVADANAAEGERVRNERVYVPLDRVNPTELMVIVRSRGEAGPLAAGVRRAVAAVDPSIPLWNVRTLSAAHAYMTRVPRAMASMALGGGAAGLLVAAAGLYGLLAFRVRQRRRELGVRLALGADGTRLATEVMVAALRLLAPALLAGLAGAWLLSPVLSAFLLGLDPRSPVVYGGVAVSFLATGLAAAAIPALRAAGVDPARTLRSD